MQVSLAEGRQAVTLRFGMERAAHLRDAYYGSLAAVCMEGPQAFVALQKRALVLIPSLAALFNLPTDLT